MSDFDFNFDIIKNYEEQGNLWVEGIATIDSPDTDDEIVDFDSVVKSMKDFFDRSPVMCVHHDLNRPIGRFTEYKPIQEGSQNKLFVKGFVPPVSNPNSYVNEQRELIKSGVLGCFSVRGKPGKRWVSKGIKHVSVKRMVEISVVSAGMHPDALFNVVSKSIDKIDNNTDKSKRNVNNMDDEDILKAFEKIEDKLSKSLSDKINSQFESYSQKLDTITKHLNIPKEEDVVFEQKVQAAAQKTLVKMFKDNAQLSELAKTFSDPELKKAFGSDGGGTSDPNAGKIDKPDSDVIKAFKDYHPSGGHWTAAAVVEYNKLKAQAEAV